MRRIALIGFTIVSTLLLSQAAQAQAMTRVVVELGGKAVAFLIEKKGDLAVSLLGATMFEVAKNAVAGPTPTPQPTPPPGGSSLDCTLYPGNTIDCIGVGRIKLRLDQQPTGMMPEQGAISSRVGSQIANCSMSQLLDKGCPAPAISAAQAWVQPAISAFQSGPATTMAPRFKPFNAIEINKLTKSLGAPKPGYCSIGGLNPAIFPECY